MKNKKLYCLGVCKNSVHGIAVQGMRFEHKEKHEIDEILKIVKRGEWEIYFGPLEESSDQMLK